MSTVSGNTCKVWGCKGEITHPSGRYCTLHECEKIDCHNKKANPTKHGQPQHCGIHQGRCQLPHCRNMKHHGEMYCMDHRCVVPGCEDLRPWDSSTGKATSETCTKHEGKRCTTPDCNHLRHDVDDIGHGEEIAEFEEHEEPEGWGELMGDVEVLIQRMEKLNQEHPDGKKEARLAKKIELARHILQDQIEDGHLDEFRTTSKTRRIEMARLVNENLSDYDVPGKKSSIYLPTFQTEWWKHERYHGLCRRCVFRLQAKHRVERFENAVEAKRQQRIRAAKKAAETRKRNEEERQAKAAKAEFARKAKIREKERVEEWKALRKVLSPTMSGDFLDECARFVRLIDTTKVDVLRVWNAVGKPRTDEEFEPKERFLLERAATYTYWTSHESILNRIETVGQEYDKLLEALPFLSDLDSMPSVPIWPLLRALEETQINDHIEVHAHVLACIEEDQITLASNRGSLGSLPDDWSKTWDVVKLYNTYSMGDDDPVVRTLVERVLLRGEDEQVVAYDLGLYQD